MDFISGSFDFFKESISSYTEKVFSKYGSTPIIIYSENFENDFLSPIFVNLVTLFNTLIVKNKLSKLWVHVADCFDKSSIQLIEIFKKEINSKKVNTEIDNEKRKISLSIRALIDDEKAQQADEADEVVASTEEAPAEETAE